MCPSPRCSPSMTSATPIALWSSAILAASWCSAHNPRLAHGRKYAFFGEPAGGLEDDAAGDLDGVVGEPLVEAAQQCHVDGGGDAVLPFLVHQHAEEMTVQIVHRIVFLTDAGRLLRVLGQQHLLGAVT